SSQSGLPSLVPKAKCRIASRDATVFHASRSRTSLPVSARERSMNSSIWASIVLCVISMILLRPAAARRRVMLDRVLASSGLARRGAAVRCRRHVAVGEVALERGGAPLGGAAVAAAAGGLHHQDLARLERRHLLAAEAAAQLARRRADLHLRRPRGVAAEQAVRAEPAALAHH